MKSAKLIPINEYLSLKLEVDRLTQMVADLTDSLAKVNTQPPSILEKGFLVSTKKQNQFIKIADIVMIKAESNYSVIFLQNGESVLTSKTLKHWYDKCNTHLFLRTHKSYVINKNHIRSYDLSKCELHLINNLIALCSEKGKREIANLK